ncbi:MAG: HlyC/CorC family transporter [Thermoleophilia bacterium]|nr:HlyC/CorC family transporter [Thermoleophilia bacterium]
MNNIWAQLVILAVLILINGILAGSEMALVSLRESQARRLGGRGKRGRVLRRLHADPNRFLSAIQIGITLAGFLASAAAAVTLADRLASYLGFFGSWASAVAVVIVTGLLTFFTLVLGELAPKRIAMQKAEGWSLAVARPLNRFAQITWPLVWLLGVSTNVVVRLAGINPKEQRPAITEEEFRDMVAASTDFSATEREVISGALEVGERNLGQIVRPRNEVFSLDENLDVHMALERLVASGHTRAPVVGARGLDDLTGLVHMRDLIGATGMTKDKAQPAVVFPETLGVLEALKALQVKRQQMAIVLNEHLVAEGIVTLEDLLEEIVGELYDEMDTDFRTVEKGPNGTLILPGTFPIHDLLDLGIELPSGPYTTIAGLVLTHLKRLPPTIGERVRVGSWCLEVAETRGLVITRVKLVPSEPD